MKNVAKFIIIRILHLLLSLRYRMRVQGLDKLNAQALKQPGGILFMPNHPTFFVDPLITALAIYKKVEVRPLMVEFMYYLPIVNSLMRLINALPVPDFVSSNNSLKRKKGDKVIQSVIDGLKQKQNFLVYPSGKAKHTAIESIAGASAVHRILQETPEANVVLVRIKGLWGSGFSRAISDTSELPQQFKYVVKALLKNLIFFTPRREVIVEFMPVPADFPRQGSRLEVNKYLEAWYNKPDGLTVQEGDLPGDSLVLVSYSMWKQELLPLRAAKTALEKDISIETIPLDIQQKVISKIAQLRECDPTTIKPQMLLSTDLGFDSLDIAELAAFLQDQYDIKNVSVSQLTTVAKLMAVAAKQIEFKEEVESDNLNLKYWHQPIKKQRITIAPGKTIPEVFLNQCQQSGKAIACADARSGIVSYAQMKLRVVLIAEYLRSLPGKYIGIMLPASVAANLMIIACQMAGKVPLMVNWTVGPRHLESVSSLSHVSVVISSWSFIERLDNVDLNGIEDTLVMLEDVVRKISLKDKLKAFIRSKQSTQSILKAFNIDRMNSDEQAVLLFTSGTENLPKGVPLSHHNILSDLKASLQVVDAYSDDIMYGILPPFHSFGFTISGILGLLSGMRVFYSPDPTDGLRLARGLGRWGVTIMCGAPTFIKGMLKAATPEDIKTMRLCITGAEKAPPELFATLEQFGKAGVVLEGYGITECAPVLTINPPGVKPKGVGKPLPGVEICIVHPETEQPFPIDKQGLILAKGPNVFSGYLNPPAHSPFTTVNGEQWYKTGDLGSLDENGFLTISGRMKRFVKMGGEMVSLASVEDALLNMGLKKGWPTNQDGPSLAICSKEIVGDKTKLFLFSRFEIPVDEVNGALKESGFSNLVKVSSVITLPELPIMGTGKVNYRLLEGDYLADKV